MITTCLYDGQGFGNQLWAYAVCRTVAIKLGLDFGIQCPERFKGRKFLDLDFGCEVRGEKPRQPSKCLPHGIRSYYRQTHLRHPETGADISTFDPTLWQISDGTKIDGNFESELYLLDLKEDIQTWFQVRETDSLDENLCLISLRGGEYKRHPDLMLPETYFRRAMMEMRLRNPNCEFAVVTDDRSLAKRYFPDLPVLGRRKLLTIRRMGLRPRSQSIGIDFSLLQRSSMLILSNSSFSWWGAWTNLKAHTVVAPMYWARHNVSNGYWSTGGALTGGWLWIDRSGRILTTEECLIEQRRFAARHTWYRSDPRP